jgi:uncharacterized protein YkwD
MRRRGALSVCVVVLLALFAVADAKARTLTRVAGRATARDRSIVSAINSFRAQHQLTTLAVGRRLSRAARAHSLDMLRHNYFAHGDFAGRMSRFHVSGTLFEENLDWTTGLASGQQVLGNWLASPPHRATLFNPNLRRIGVAAPVGPFEGFSTVTVVTADFAG